ncbi:MAG TPA: F0F1 ATP synthase subunit B' [Alphaproteobacteria bacterium]|nr:F0F1 ATP synthase subunit B' [Alphaproteobacteria bacterium]
MAKLASLAIALAGAVSGVVFTTPEALAAGLPQLDPAVFSPQIIWLAITFPILYLLMWRLALPRISKVLEERQHRIENDLNKAEEFRASAETASQAYDALMAEVRESARDEIRKMRDVSQQEVELRVSEQTRRLAEKVKAAEARIGEARRKAEGDIRLVAAELARETVAKLGGGTVDKTAAAAVVENLLKESG